MSFHKITITKIYWHFKTAFLYKPFFGHIGKRSYLGKLCYISGKKKIFIGDYVRIYPYYRIEVFSGRLYIGNNVSIGNNLHIACGRDLVIGNDVTISSNVFISDIDHDFNQMLGSVMDSDLIYKETSIGDGSFLGHNSTILAGSHIGKHCVVGSNTLIKGDFP